MLGLLRSTGRMNLPSVIVKEGKESHAAFALTPQTAEVMDTVYECLVKMEKALNLWMEDISRKHV